jgi:hypothetical protein
VTSKSDSKPGQIPSCIKRLKKATNTLIIFNSVDFFFVEKIYLILNKTPILLPTNIDAPKCENSDIFFAMP